ncbi:hypothetical protein CC85DRAFT_207361 [Cutaneotrichosporon oleaginosum]|uniref:Uncharacterized protein n=1 Tax=Cutaneotrichosporon oleaginosum TaxID=879819 RepID=A0A0J1AUZ7_9TREE|nr:uncharacterized protein CC85DRAFT_207361 [Cutaneotrichosporon oleaginosum]KLT39114.1 hypothetical protein CC85DRAFT_207361 [Cutaneotrichosporon oleaginosum]TXT10454.1 hypothetical protein COLE_04388 [Cutaneotrichosporon oleaginosum]
MWRLQSDDNAASGLTQQKSVEPQLRRLTAGLRRRQQAALPRRAYSLEYPSRHIQVERYAHALVRVVAVAEPPRPGIIDLLALRRGARTCTGASTSHRAKKRAPVPRNRNEHERAHDEHEERDAQLVQPIEGAQALRAFGGHAARRDLGIHHADGRVGVVASGAGALAELHDVRYCLGGCGGAGGRNGVCADEGGGGCRGEDARPRAQWRSR